MHLLLLSFILTLSTQAGSSSRSSNIFELQPKDQDVKEGRSAILRCALKHEFADEYTLSWVMDGENAVNQRRQMTTARSQLRIGLESKLKIDKIDKKLDAGEFQCIANKTSNPKVKAFSNRINLNIKWIDVENVVRVSPPASQEVLPGVKVVLKCNASGKPRPQLKDIRWMLNDKDILKNKSSPFSFKSTKLIIDEVQLRTFDGVYSCCAGNKCSLTKYNLKVRDKETPVLVKAPEDVVVPLKGNAVFTCIFNAANITKIQWFHDDDVIKPPKSRQNCRTCDFGNGTLLVKDVKDRFQGTYFCEATGSNKLTARGSAQLIIAYIKMSDASPEQELLDLGQDHEKHCGPIDAKPEASITWYKDNNRIIAGSLSDFTVSDKTLIIMSAQQSDEGEYKCVASNIAGNVSKIFQFYIKRKPNIKSNLISRTEKEGRAVTLNCEAGGWPQPTYTWYRNKTVLISEDLKGVKFDIKSISPADSGVYKCVAKNDLGEDVSSATIRVEERLKIIDPRPHDVCVEVNKTASIICSARGIGIVEVDWTIDTTDTTKFAIIENSRANKTLKILANPKSGDRWGAFCLARDSEDPAVSDQADIKVSVGKKPNIFKRPHDAVVFEKQTVRFDCGIHPEIELEKLYWTIQNGNVSAKQFTIKDNSDSFKYTIMNNGSFIIKNTSGKDSGTYACHYQACGFNVNESAQLTIAERDQPPATDNNEPENNPDGSTPRYQKVQTIALAAGGSIAYLGISIVIIVYCRRKRHYKKGMAANTSDGEAIMMNGTSHQLDTAPITQLPDEISDFFYDHSKLEHIAEIGRGNFGEVLLSKAPGLIPDMGDDVLVMVKKLSPGISCNSDDSLEDSDHSSKNSLRLEFNREINLLLTANHENISRLLGVCNEHSKDITTPDCLITEYLEWGILKLCLHASHEGKIQRFSKHAKMKMCCQIAAGLEHLSSQGLGHLDVATRNCLISSKNIVKLSVLSLSKDGFEKEYCNHNGRLRSIRWMPPEILHQDKVHAKSDVWSYGVTCWEIFSLGKTPYSDLSDEEFLQEMETSHPPTLPTVDGSKRIASLISKCCQQDPTLRPEFYQIVKKLQSVIRGEARSKTSEENPSDVHKPLLPQDDDLKEESKVR